MTGSEAEDCRVSVCMATYNGAEFVAEQLRSILDELTERDEVVVVDDGSADATLQVLRGFQDRRVRLHPNEDNLGYVRTFARAMTLSRGRFLILADQDDVWVAGRVDAMVQALRRVDVVATNLTTLGGPPGLRGPLGQKDWRLRAEDSTHHVRNIVGILAGARPYYGSAMGVRREALRDVLPTPPWLNESHDLWLALYGNVARSIEHLDIVSVQRRMHGANQTPERPRSLPLVVRSRLLLLRATLTLARRVLSAGGVRGR